jgi:hypothetical protein
MYTLFQTHLEKKINHGTMKVLELAKYSEWANKWDRIAFICTFGTYIVFILLYVFICLALHG